MIEERLARTAAKLAALRGRLAPFGPPLAEERVAAFEERNAVRLPDAYRRFVTTIGNGGPGPYRGLLALDPDLYDPGYAGTFPCGPDDLPETWPRETFEWAYRHPYRGTLRLARQHDIEWEYHDTAEPESRLVLSGPGRGRVVMVDADGDRFPPIHHPAPDFLAWYDEWLDDPFSRVHRYGSDFDRRGVRLDDLRDADPDEAVRTVHVVAARMGNRRTEQAPPHVCEALADAALHAPSARVRAASAWALRRARWDVGRHALPLLRGGDPRVRRIAVGHVAASRALDRAAAGSAIRGLLADPDPGVRAAAATAAGDAAVLRALLVAPASRARLAAREQVPALVRRAPDGRDALVRAARPLLRDPDPDVRAAAVAALGAVRAAVPWAGPMLHAALTDPAAAVRRAAAHRLLHSAERGAGPQAASVLLADPDPVIRHETLVRLAPRVHVRHWGAEARALLADPDPQVRAAALDALLEAGTPPPDDAWAPLLAVPCGPVRHRVLRSTVRRGGPRPGGAVHEELHRILTAPDRGLRSTLSFALERTCTAECRPVIAAALAAEDDRVIRYTLGAFLETVSPGGTPADP
ncbi:SMI1/KNR4 family protein [Actinomadura rifamycini]|uniref:SMI1/KNR4 family protein n=1 Tax=Actinomadura rifamycini TaxID=31962 RepID=UPI00047B8278|nr:SMI1/KNR4 family protein [Actinomadura rifamycini]